MVEGHPDASPLLPSFNDYLIMKFAEYGGQVTRRPPSHFTELIRWLVINKHQPR